MYFLAFGLKGLGWEVHDMMVTAWKKMQLFQYSLILGVFLPHGEMCLIPPSPPRDSCAALVEGTESVT